MLDILINQRRALLLPLRPSKPNLSSLTISQVSLLPRTAPLTAVVFCDRRVLQRVLARQEPITRSEMRGGIPKSGIDREESSERRAA